MSEIKIGDKGTGSRSGFRYTVIGIDGDVLWVKGPNGGRASCARELFIPVPTFFEVGKTYQYRFNAVWRFTCHYVGEADEKYAVGSGPRGKASVLRLNDFENWEEI